LGLPGLRKERSSAWGFWGELSEHRLLEILQKLIFTLSRADRPWNQPRLPRENLMAVLQASTSGNFPELLGREWAPEAAKGLRTKVQLPELLYFWTFKKERRKKREIPPFYKSFPPTRSPEVEKLICPASPNSKQGSVADFVRTGSGRKSLFPAGPIWGRILSKARVAAQQRWASDCSGHSEAGEPQPSVSGPR